MFNLRFFLFLLLTMSSVSAVSQVSTPTRERPLADGWQIRSSCETKATGAEISNPGFRESDWLSTRVPSTVLAAQVNAGMFKDPFFGKNLLKIPGTDYPVGKIYAKLPVTADSPYRCSWWYRTEFRVSSAWSKRVWIHFSGINYRANIWVNGKQIADEQHVRGAYRAYDFDITDHVVRGKVNAIAVETFIQSETDFGINFVDWNPAPADKSMGLWRDVSLRESGAVTLRSPAVITHFTDDSLETAELTVIADLQNVSDQSVQTIVRGNIRSINFEQKVELGPGEKKTVRFTPEQYPQLRVSKLELWWPYQYGKPVLHSLKMTASTDGSTSDEASTRFGVREIDAKINDKGALQFRVNRKNILIRGGGWSPDMFYREPKDRLLKEFKYVKDMHLNTVRLEGKLGTDEIFNIADEMGVLIMAGWCCCDHWEHWDKWAAGDLAVANASLYSQISRLRAHPSVFVWLNGSDGPPPADVESAYIATLKERDWPNPFISSASQKPTTVTGPSGVKMTGPYDYVPPEYWYIDKSKYGGAYSFNTETSPGPAIPSAANVRRTLPKESWWPQDDVWNYHAGLGSFTQYNNFNTAMNAEFGAANSLEEYTRKANWMAYEGERAMFEAYSSNKYGSTGVIQWMLNNAWPSFIWHLYDYYLVPGGGYFGTKKANEPLHILYRYDDRTVAVVNSELDPHQKLVASARLFTLEGKEVFSKDVTIDVDADGVSTLFAIPSEQGPYFLKLALTDAMKKSVSENFYVVTDKLATFDWEKSTFFFTPSPSFADYKALNQLPKAAVRAKVLRTSSTRGTVRLANTGKTIAFFLHAQVIRNETGEEVAPVIWSDNFISLLPGEQRILTFEVPDGFDRSSTVVVDGWNIDPPTVKSAAK